MRILVNQKSTTEELTQKIFERLRSNTILQRRFLRRQCLLSEEPSETKKYIEIMGNLNIACAELRIGEGKKKIVRQFMSKNYLDPMVRKVSSRVLEDFNRKGKIVGLRTKDSKKTKELTHSVSLIPEYVRCRRAYEPRIFTTLVMPNADGNVFERYTDSEAQIFEEIASKLGEKKSVKGTLSLYTERPACESCSGVVRQFSERFKDIKVFLFNGNGECMVFENGKVIKRYEFEVVEELLVSRKGTRKGIRERDELKLSDFQSRVL